MADEQIDSAPQTQEPAFVGPHMERAIGLILAVATFAAVLFTINDPGLTVDEPINVGHGKRMIHAFTTDPGCLLRSQDVYAIWRHGHEHPPLARFLVGCSHWLGDPDRTRRDVMAPTAGRPASAVAMAVIVFLCTRLGWRISGPVAGIASGVSVALMPRLFAHAHFASPEVISSAFFLLGMVSAGWALSASRTSAETPPTPSKIRWFAAGVVLGTALLTKLTVVLLPVAVTAVAFMRLRWRAVAPLVIWSSTALVVFVAGWPWLWPFDFPNDPPGWMGTLHRLVDFLRVGVDRATVYVDYFGTQFPNESSGVPWHFVWVFFFTTVPIGLQVVGVAFGIRQCMRRVRTSEFAGLLLAAIGVIQLVFTLPLERYDGERLFLMVFPMWAVVIGVGTAFLFDHLTRRCGRGIALGGVFAFLIAQSYGVIHFHPYQLSYYNALIGGLSGADGAGLEATYWGDTVSRELLDQFAALAEPEERAILLPTLYAGHATYLTLSCPSMLEKNQFLVPGDQLEALRCRWAILFNRSGYVAHDALPKSIVANGKIRAEVSRDGVWLSRVYEISSNEERRWDR